MSKALETKSFEFKIEDADSTAKYGKIRGFASTFGNIDLGGDVVDKGAFKQTIKQNKGKFPILADHNPYKQIGWNLQAEETDKGLLVEGEIDLENSDGRNKYSLAQKALEIGTKMGLSIGYATIKAVPDEKNPRVRRLKELKLYEYSIVTFPMNTDALITDMKQFRQDMSKSDFLNLVRNRANELGIKMSEVSEFALRCEAAIDSGEPLNEHSQKSLIQKMDAFLKRTK